jgi:hypothetical protein
LKEKFGIVRVSTAYEFFTAVKKLLVFSQHYATTKDKYFKPLMAATNYVLLYVASDEADALGKVDVDMILDRSTMWDCTVLTGSSSKYEFCGMDHVPAAGAHNIGMRFLPCPCKHCYQNDFAACSNQLIVGVMEYSMMKYKASPVCHDTLEEPLEFYKNGVLIAFLKSNKKKWIKV